MADVNANIAVNVSTANALVQIKDLQRQLSTLYSSIAKGSAAAATAQRTLERNLLNSINATGKFHAQMGVVRTSTESFTHALEKNKLSMGQYFKYAGASTKTFGKFFRSEFDTIDKVAQERVKRMQTQYIKMGRDASGAMRAISVTPLSLNMKDYETRLAVAAQKQALFNQLIKQGSTNLLNFGKNTQWAGRQLMVGFTVPLIYFGSAASKVFMDLEKQAIKFKRVYGDVFTTTEETNRALNDIENLAKSFTKYGVAVTQTMEMAAKAAAMGKQGAELTAQVAQATKLAVLGSVEQEQALDTTISLTNAFGIAAEDLAKKIDFLNAVENQTVLSIEDLTIAIPKAGPVVRQLGGDVEDLAFFMTAMREGGINASEGANALKSGLASLINPSKKASDMLMGMGINIKGIVEQNAGDLKATVIGFAQALDTLSPLQRSRAIEQLFGKFQFARLSTLFQNITKDGTQAARTLQLAGASVEELAILSEREMKTIEDAVGVNFKQAIEDLKVAIAPIGKFFLETITPIIKKIGEWLGKFNDLGDGTKKFIVVASTLIGIIGPTFLMTFGLVANGVANLIKLFASMRNGFQRLTGTSKVLGQNTNYLTTEQLEAETVAASLNQVHSRLTQQFTLESEALVALTAAYNRATAAAKNLLLANPGLLATGAKPGPKPVRRASGGKIKGPGTATSDSIPAYLSNGEYVIQASSVNKYGTGFFDAVNAGKFANGGMVIPRFYGGGNEGLDNQRSQSNKNARLQSAHLMTAGEIINNPLIIKALSGMGIKDLSSLAFSGYGFGTSAALPREINNSMAQFWRNTTLTPAAAKKLGIPSNLIGDKIPLTAVDARKLAKFYSQQKGMKHVADFFNDPKYSEKIQRSIALASAKARVGSSISQKDFDRVFNEELQVVRKAFQGGKTHDQIQNNLIKGFLLDKDGKLKKDALSKAYITTGREGSIQRFRLSDLSTPLKFAKNRGSLLYSAIQASRFGGGRWSQIGDTSRFLQLNDGIYSVPGTGNKDTVPAMLTPGEAVIPKTQAQKYGELVDGIISDNIPGYAKGKKGRKGKRAKKASEYRYRKAIGGVPVPLGPNTNNPQGFLDFQKVSGDISIASIAMKDIMKDAGVSMSKVKLEFDQWSKENQGLLKQAAERVKRGESIDKAYYEVNEKYNKDMDVVGKETKKLKDAAKKRLPQLRKDLAEAQRTARRMGIDLRAEGGLQKLAQALPKNIIAQALATPGKYQYYNPARGAITSLFGGSFGQYGIPSPMIPEDMRKALRDYQMSTEHVGGYVRGARTQAPEPTVSRKRTRVRGTSEDRKAKRLQQAQEREQRRTLENEKVANDTREKINETEKRSLRQRIAEGIKNRSARPGGIAGGVGGFGMALSSAAFMGSMAGGTIGDISQKIMMPAMLLSMLPMLQNPAVALLAGIGALLGTIWYTNEKFKESANKAFQLTKTMGSSQQSIQNMAIATGKVSPTEIMRRRQQEGYGLLKTRVGTVSFGQQFLMSEQGKALTESVRQTISQSNISGAARELATQLAAQVASGIITPDQARSIAANIGKEIRSYKFSINAIAEVNKILGPNGENLLEDGIQLKLNLVRESGQKAVSSIDQYSATRNVGEIAKPAAGAIAAGGAAGGAAALVAARVLSATPIPYIQQIAWVVTALTAAASAWNYFSKDYKERIGKTAGETIAFSSMALENQQAMLDALDIQYEKEMAIAKAKKDQAKQDEIQTRYEKSRKRLLDQNRQIVQQILDAYNQATPGTQKQLSSVLDEQIKNQFKGMDALIASGAMTRLNEAMGAGQVSQDIAYRIKLELLNGGLSTTAFSEIVTLIQNGGGDIVYNILTKFPGREGFDLVSLISAFKGNAKQALIDIIPRIKPDKVGKFTTLMNTILALRANPDIPVDIIANTILKDEKKMEDLASDLEIIKNNDGKVSLTILQRIFTDPKELAQFKLFFPAFDKMSAEEQKRAVILFDIQTNAGGLRVEGKNLEDWLKANPDKTAANFFAEAMASTSTADFTTVLGGNDGGNGTPSAFQQAIKALQDQKKEILNTAKAYDILRKSGFSAAAALRLSKDTTLANALANAKNSKEIQKLIKLIKEVQRLSNQDAIDVINKEVESLNKKRDAQQEINDELQRQEDFQMKQMELSRSQAEAKISGNYLEAAIIGQQRLLEQSDYNRETENLKIESRISRLEEIVRKLENGERLTNIEKALVNPLLASAGVPLIDGKGRLGKNGKIVGGAGGGGGAGGAGGGGAGGAGGAGGGGGGTMLYPPGYGTPNTQMSPDRTGTRVIPTPKSGKDLWFDKTTGKWTNAVSIYDLNLNPSKFVPRENWKPGMKYADGGFIRGKGTPTSDSIPAYLSNGEYVVKASSVKQYGTEFLDAVNAQKFAKGGLVPGFKDGTPGGLSGFWESLKALNNAPFKNTLKTMGSDLSMLANTDTWKALGSYIKNQPVDFTREALGISPANRLFREGTYAKNNLNTRESANMIWDMLGVIPGIGAIGKVGKVGKIAKAAKTGARNLAFRSNRIKSVADMKQLRTRSNNPNLESEIEHPGMVSVVTGRSRGPGTYFAKDYWESATTYRNFGENIYKIDANKKAILNTLRSKGYIRGTEELNKLIEEYNLKHYGSYEPETGAGAYIFGGIKDLDYFDPLIKWLRMEKKYVGYNHGQNLQAYTDWRVGDKLKLKASSYKNGGLVPGFKDGGKAEANPFGPYGLATPMPLNSPFMNWIKNNLMGFDDFGRVFTEKGIKNKVKSGLTGLAEVGSNFLGSGIFTKAFKGIKSALSFSKNIKTAGNIASKIKESQALKAIKNKKLQDLSNKEYKTLIKSIYDTKYIKNVNGDIAPTYKLKGMGESFTFSGYGENLSDLSKMGVSVIPKTPQGLLSKALEIDPNNKHVATMLENFKNGNIGTSETKLLDSMLASSAINKKGKLARKESSDAFAMVLASLTGDVSARRILNFKKSALFANINKTRIQSLNERLKQFGNYAGDAPNAETIPAIHSTKYPISYDKNGNIVLSPHGTHTAGNTVGVARPSLHFTLEAPVKSHLMGNWDEAEKLIVSPFGKMIKDNKLPETINSTDTWWTLSPGQKLSLSQHSVINPYTDEVAYKNELIKRGLIKENESVPPIISDPSNKEVLQLIKSKYSRSDIDWMTQNSNNAAGYIDKNPDTVAREIALQMAKEQVGIKSPPVAMDSWSLADRGRQQNIDKLGQKYGMSNAIHSESMQAILEKSALNSWFNEGSNRFTGNLLDSYRMLALHGLFPSTKITKKIKDPLAFSRGGLIKGPGTGTSDSILGFMQNARWSGMKKFKSGIVGLSNGESIINAQSTSAYGSILDSINRGTYDPSQGTVYNTITMNITGQNPEEIADRVISKLKVIESKSKSSNKVIING